MLRVLASADGRLHADKVFLHICRRIENMIYVALTPRPPFSAFLCGVAFLEKQVVEQLFPDRAERTPSQRRASRTPRTSRAATRASRDGSNDRAEKQQMLSLSSSCAGDDRLEGGPIDTDDGTAAVAATESMSVDTTVDQEDADCRFRSGCGRQDESVGLRIESRGGASKGADDGAADVEICDVDSDGYDRSDGRSMEGAATFVRRRSSGVGLRRENPAATGGGGCGGGETDGGWRGQDAIGTRRSRRTKRTLWSIAQQADELSQSNFVTGVFADVFCSSATGTSSPPLPSRADTVISGAGGAMATPRRDGGPVKTSASIVTAAAYGDPSMFNSRRAPKKDENVVATGTATSTAAGLRTTCALGGTEVGSENADGDNGDSGGNADDQRDQQDDNDDIVGVDGLDSDRANGDGSNGDGGGGEDDDADDGSGVSGSVASDPPAADDAVRWLSQVLSANDAVKPSNQNYNHVTSGSTSRSTESAPAPAEVSEAAERMAERQIADAPRSALAQFFPDWEENIRFVCRQSVTDLEDALRSLREALVAEGVEGDGELCRNGSNPARLKHDRCKGQRFEGVENGKEEEEEKDGCLDAPMRHFAVGGGWHGRRKSSKARALRFFEKVIVETLASKTPGGGIDGGGDDQDGGNRGCGNLTPVAPAVENNRSGGGDTNDCVSGDCSQFSCCHESPSCHEPDTDTAKDNAGVAGDVPPYGAGSEGQDVATTGPTTAAGGIASPEGATDDVIEIWSGGHEVTPRSTAFQSEKDSEPNANGEEESGVGVDKSGGGGASAGNCGDVIAEIEGEDI